MNLYNNNYYHYDPSNYHGTIPLLHWINSFLYSRYLRFFIPAYADTVRHYGGCIVVSFTEKDWQNGFTDNGITYCRFSGKFFFSRDTIHETYLVFFSLAVVVSFFLYSETRKSRYILFAAASLAFIITIKETYIMTFAVYALSLAIAYGYEIVFLPKGARFQHFKDVFATFAIDCKKNKYAIGISIGGIFAYQFFVLLIFFTYYAGIKGILTTLKIWSKTGVHIGGHAKPFYLLF